MIVIILSCVMPPPQKEVISRLQEEILWRTKVLSTESSVGLVQAVIFYLCKCFGVWQGKELRQIKTEHIKFGEDELGKFVTIDLISALESGRVIKRYDDSCNPRSVYKIIKTYLGYLANDGPLILRPISSIKDYIVYSPWPLGVSMVDQTVGHLMKETGYDGHFGNISASLMAIDIMKSFGAGSHCAATWIHRLLPAYKVFCRSLLFGECSALNCEEKSQEACLVISHLLDPPNPSEILENIKLEPGSISSLCPDMWKSNQQPESKLKNGDKMQHRDEDVTVTGQTKVRKRIKRTVPAAGDDNSKDLVQDRAKLKTGKNSTQHQDMVVDGIELSGASPKFSKTSVCNESVVKRSPGNSSSKNSETICTQQRNFKELDCAQLENIKGSKQKLVRTPDQILTVKKDIDEDKMEVDLGETQGSFGGNAESTNSVGSVVGNDDSTVCSVEDKNMKESYDGADVWEWQENEVKETEIEETSMENKNTCVSQISEVCQMSHAPSSLSDSVGQSKSSISCPANKQQTFAKSGTPHRIREDTGTLPCSSHFQGTEALDENNFCHAKKIELTPIKIEIDSTTESFMTDVCNGTLDHGNENDGFKSDNQIQAVAHPSSAERLNVIGGYGKAISSESADRQVDLNPPVVSPENPCTNKARDAKSSDVFPGVSATGCKNDPVSDIVQCLTVAHQQVKNLLQISKSDSPTELERTDLFHNKKYVQNSSRQRNVNHFLEHNLTVQLNGVRHECNLEDSLHVKSCNDSIESNSSKNMTRSDQDKRPLAVKSRPLPSLKSASSSSLCNEKTISSEENQDVTNSNSDPPSSPDMEPSLHQSTVTSPSLSDCNRLIPNLCSGQYRYISDRQNNVAYQSIQIENGPGDSQLFTIADLPLNIPENQTDRDCIGWQTSEMNFGDYFPPNTVIPAEAIKLLTRQGKNGLEVIVKIDSSVQKLKSTDGDQG